MGFRSAIEEIAQYLPVNFLFHPRSQMNREVPKLHPSDGEKFPAASGKIDGRSGLVQLAEKIKLLLTGESPPVRPRRKFIAVRSAPSENSVMLRENPDLFANFPAQRILRTFPGIAAALGKLPAFRIVGALRDEHASVGTPQNGGDVRPVARRFFLGHRNMFGRAVRGGKRTAHCQRRALR